MTVLSRHTAQPAGSTAWKPYTDRVRMAGANTDDTGDSVDAWFGDVLLAAA